MTSVLGRIAHFQNRRDEVPNQELARSLAAKKDRADIREIAAGLWHELPQVRSDCLKVLYEVGYLDPALIAGHVDDFLKLLDSKANRLVWGGMIALSVIAALKAAEIFEHRDAIRRAMEGGSVITIDNGVKTLALVAAGDDVRREAILPYLLAHLAACRPKDVPQHCESTLPAVSAGHKSAFIEVLRKRLPELTPGQAARVKRAMKQAELR
jgi:hypothetical protein